MDEYADIVPGDSFITTKATAEVTSAPSLGWPGDGLFTEKVFFGVLPRHIELIAVSRNVAVQDLILICLTPIC
ncbi:MAG: hypothetical protein QNJ40_16105 [Xanthomonadales bacterium]|nr:hypothetical protein [Xanthomonadales bacterium]